MLVRQVDDRRVKGGWLGCPNCRRDYPVEDGRADLRLEPGAERVEGAPYEDEELPLKLLALSGLAGERGYIVLGERLGHAAEGIVALAPELEVLVVGGPSRVPAGQAGVSGVLADHRLPLAERRLRCVAVAPGDDPDLVTAAARLVAMGGRLLLFDASKGDLEAARLEGLTVVTESAGVAVAERKTGSLPIFG